MMGLSEAMHVSFRSGKTEGRGRISEMGDELRIATGEAPDEGEPVVVVLLGADGIDQARILGVVSRIEPDGFSVRSPADEAERASIRRGLVP